MAVLTVTLNPAVDRIVLFDKFVVGKDQRAASSFYFSGGKGVNVARALTGIGVKAASLTFLDGHPEKVRVNTTIVDAQGRVTRVIEPGPTASRAAQACFLRAFPASLGRSEFVIFSGSLAPGMKPDFLIKLIDRVQQQGIRCAVDTSGVALDAIVKHGVDLVKPNRPEAEALLGYRLSSPARVSKALRSLAGCGIKDVLISLGKDGLAGYDGRDEVFVSTEAVVGGHAVGCGDAALAGFVRARLAKKDFKACVRYAAACGAAAAAVDIPAGIILKDVKAFERKIVADKE
ncbi:MAG: bifunctional hydroxymethylpyrimidine kinase/phosphomethylpyrimidine kinase [Candidatus Omnitrophica bacterium]|nr:bifunctional hydroxymethylpyrimidine kinase/phosphomethylpyrimidine kinase [Candidatus Omnitrophota bacterium]